MQAAPPYLSIIVPAYNEASRIGASLVAIADWVAEQPYSCELVVVDDGSSDDTANVVRELAGPLPFPARLIRYEHNRGKGRALKLGFAATCGERILFSDADLSTPIEFGTSALAVLEQGADLAIGTRKAPDATIRLHQPWYRERLGQVFTLIVRALIADVTDVTCGFKAFRGEAGRDLFSRVRIDDWSFDAELLLIARSRGLRIEEFPVRWEDRAGTKVRLVRDVVSSLIGLVRIEINAAMGRYASETPADVVTESWSDGRDPAPSGRLAADATS